MFSGLSAFPLTPLNESSIDETTFARLVERLVVSGVDSIGVLGSTGSYAYLDRAERLRIVQLAVARAHDVPVVAGIGALRTRDVLDLARDAQDAGAKGLLLAPVSYQKLTHDEVFDLFESVARSISIPLCVYDNPSTTHFEFTDALHGRIAQLPNVASIKIPPVAGDVDAVRVRLEALRAHVPAHVTIGISGDASAATGLLAGCDAWYSVIGGLFPKIALTLTRHAQTGNDHETALLDQQLQPLWTLFGTHGSLRVIATAAEILGLVSIPCLPLPIKSLHGEARDSVAEVLKMLKPD